MASRLSAGRLEATRLSVGWPSGSHRLLGIRQEQLSPCQTSEKGNEVRALIQRVTQANVSVSGESVGSCDRGLLVLLGVGHDDDEATAAKLWNKISGLRIFEDDDGKTNLSLADVAGEALVVSQFTLYANCRRGRRPSFTDAAGPDLANNLYEHFCELVEADLGPEHVGRGIFGAMMEVSLVNDGPFTIWLDTNEL